MKHTFIILLLFSSFFAHCQNVQVQYADQSTSLSYKNMSPAMIETIKDGYNKIKQYFILNIDNHKSSYTYEKIVLPNKVHAKGMKNTYVYKDNNNVDLLKFIKGTAYHINEEIPQLKWKIIKEYDTILGYKVMKAELITDECYLGHVFPDISVWFTREIPISNGPFIYGGLPGLILKLEMRNATVLRTVTAEDISFEKKEVVKPTPIKVNKEAKLTDICDIPRR